MKFLIDKWWNKGLGNIGQEQGKEDAYGSWEYTNLPRLVSG